MAGDLPGDVKDAVAQSLRFSACVLAVEQQLLGPDHDVVGCERELKPGGVGLEGVEGEVPGAGGLQCLDTVLDLSVLAIECLKRGDVLPVLVGDEALEAVPVHVREGELRAGMRALTATDQ